VIRNNYGDQGPGSEDGEGVGWFGIELKCFEDVLIEGNVLRGGHALISLPDSNRVTVRGNTLDLRGYTFWGVEIAKAHDVVVEGNLIFGDGEGSGDQAVSTNSGSQRAVVRGNEVSAVRTLFVGGHNAVVTDNCLSGVRFVIEHDTEDNTLERNGPC
jgi:hypothetical protein